MGQQLHIAGQQLHIVDPKKKNMATSRWGIPISIFFFKIVISLIIIITFISIPAYSSIPEGGHKNLICFDCHTEEELDSDDCSGCHMYASKQEREELHNPNTCRTCHSVKDSKTFHTIHVNYTCSKCHSETGNAKPDKTMSDCAGCHGGKLHDIHGQNLDQLCITCHGKVPSSTPQQIVGSSNSVNQLYAKVVNYKEYTLFEILKKILRWQ